MTEGSSGGSSLHGPARKSPYSKPSIKIQLKNHFNSKVYNSSSPVAGELVITTKRDTRFDSIQIFLIGLTRTVVDGVNSPHVVSHTFLKLIMPIPESTYPVPRVLESGRAYTIPFNFVIPSELTINACNHHIVSGRLQDHHVRLPPTMGLWDKDDLAPQTARVEYAVKARVFSHPDLQDRKVKLMETSHVIRVLPASVEEPPLNITRADKLYRMSHAKTMRRNILSGKAGRLTAEAAQPGCVFLSPDGRSATATTAQVDLRFDPASADVPPPRITAVSGKLVAHTFYSAGTIAYFPNLGDWNKQYSLEKRSLYTASTSLAPIALPSPSFDLTHTRWEQHLVRIARRDSGYLSGGDVDAASDSESSCSSNGVHSHGHSHGHGSQPTVDRHTRTKPDEAKKTSSAPLYHATTLRFPVHLPTGKKALIPTFHSCIASRVYTLQLAITVAAGPASATISLSLPLQVAVESPSAATAAAESAVPALDLDGLPSFETAVEEAEADAFLRPRVMLVPDEVYMRTSVLPGAGAAALPGYAASVAAR